MACASWSIPISTRLTFIVGDSTAVEFYETPDAPVRLSVLDVGVLGYNIGVAGMWALLVTDPGSFVKVTYTPPTGPQHAGLRATEQAKSASQSMQQGQLMADWLTLEQYKAWARIG